MILLAAEGGANDAIARSLRTRREVVSLWRFFEERLAGLEDHARLGRPRAFSPKRSASPSKRSRVNSRRAPAARSRVGA